MSNDDDDSAYERWLEWQREMQERAESEPDGYENEEPTDTDWGEAVKLDNLCEQMDLAAWELECITIIDALLADPPQSEAEVDRLTRWWAEANDAQ